MDKLNDLLERFRNDENRNTVKADGTHRFDKKIAWIETMVKDYAEKLNMTTDEVVDLMEGKRDYSWPNYYQPANFPGIESDALYGIYDTFAEFRDKAKKQWAGFKCPKCGTVSLNPQECVHRRKNALKCDWCAYGLFRSGKGIIVKEAGLEMIPIFEPVPIDGEEG